MTQCRSQGRNFVRGMVENIVRYKNGEENAIHAIFENINGYIYLLRSHISKENNILFRMADNTLSENDQQNLLNEFIKVEKGDGKLADHIKAIEKLEDKYKSNNRIS